MRKENIRKVRMVLPTGMVSHKGMILSRELQSATGEELRPLFGADVAAECFR